MEWLNDSSANVVFRDSASAARALALMCTPLGVAGGEFVQWNKYAQAAARRRPFAPY